MSSKSSEGSNEDVEMGTISGPSSKSQKHAAVLNNDVAAIEYFLSKGINVKDEANNQNTFLHYAVKEKREDVFNLLIKKNDLQVNVQNSTKQTPLHMAIEEGEYFYVKSLLDLGADVNLADFQLNSPLHYAVSHSKITELLLEYGADTEFENIFHETPLFLAINNKTVSNYLKTEVVSILLSFGATPNAYSKHFQNTPFGMAVKQGNILLEELLFTYVFATSSTKTCTIFDMICAFESNFSQVFLEDNFKISCDWYDRSWGLSILHFSTKLLICFLKQYTDVAKIVFVDDDYFTIKDIIVFIKKRTLWPNDNEVYDLISTLFEYGSIGTHLVQKQDELQVSFLQAFLYTCGHEEALTKCFCLWASYGVNFYLGDLLKVYYMYGYCDLFEFMINTNISYFDLHHRQLFQVIDYSVMPILIYDVQFRIEDLWGAKSFLLQTEANAKKMFSFFALPQFKEHCLQIFDKSSDISQIVKNMPNVPSLIELSRNTLRQSIIKSQNINNSSSFQSYLNHLVNTSVIPREVKDILSFRTEIYSL